MQFIKWFLTVFCLMLPLSAFSQAKVGTAGMTFLKVGVSARAIGMGEAFTAVADDASSLYYNPGGLIQMRNRTAMFSMVDYPAGLKFVYVGGVIPVPQFSGVFGVQVTSMFTDEMLETTPEMPYGTGRTFNASDLAVGAVYSQRLTDKFSVGANLKLLNGRLADVSATGWAADMGTYYTTGWQDLNIGMVIQHFGPDMTYVNTPFPLPMMFKFGMSMLVVNNATQKFLVAAEFQHPNDNIEQYNIGAEFTYANMVSFRAGKKVNAWKRDTWDEYIENRSKNPFVEYPVLNDDGGLSMDGVGVGFGVNFAEIGLGLDYALAGLGTLGYVHRFTLSYRLEGLW